MAASIKECCGCSGCVHYRVVIGATCACRSEDKIMYIITFMY